MKFAYLLIMASLLSIDIDKIGKINSLKSEAKKAFTEGEYEKAIDTYRFLIDSMDVNEDEVRLNLAHSYFHAQDTANAYSAYQSLTQSKSPKYQSQAYQQMGVLSNRQGNFEDALTNFKQSLKRDPANEGARYNYEMVKKKLEEQKKEQQQQQDQNKDQKEQEKQETTKRIQQKQDQNKDQKEQENKDQKDQENKDQEQKQNEEQKKEKQEQEKKNQEEQQNEEQENKEQEAPPSLSEKLKEMQISEEKARMILEAMKNQEIQYLQQNKRKATKPKDKSKPDW
ncbi:MAG: tetratricopeptide repeat protein [Flammeovirgaceae bacterium]|nr:tetratricopeptide repeat protein [Flammeovirgaceae bacterium]